MDGRSSRTTGCAAVTARSSRCTPWAFRCSSCPLMPWGAIGAASFFMAGLSVLLAVRAPGSAARADRRRGRCRRRGLGRRPEPASARLRGPHLHRGPRRARGGDPLEVRTRRGGRSSARRAFGLGALLAFLPWLNVRYAGLSAVLALFVLASAATRAPGGDAGSCLPWLAAVALALYHQVLYGFYRSAAGLRPTAGVRPRRRCARGCPGLLLDQEFGLLVYAPIFVLAGPGIVALVADGSPSGPHGGGARGRRARHGRHLAHVARRVQSARAVPGARSCRSWPSASPRPGRGG